MIHRRRLSTRVRAIARCDTGLKGSALQELKMSHRIALAGLISVVIWIGYYYLFPPVPPAPPQEVAAGDSAGEPAGESGSAEPGAPAPIEKIDQPASPTPPTPDIPIADVVEHQLVNELLRITVDNRPGGLITKVEPLAEQFHDNATGTGIDFMMLGEERTLEVAFVPDETDFAWSRVAGQVRRKDDRSIELARRQGDVEVIETLTLLPGYEVRYEVAVRNYGAGAQVHRLALGTRMGLSPDSSRYDIHRALCRTPEEMEDFDFDDVEDENETIKGGLDWWAVDSKYFVQAVVPGERMSGCVVSSDEAGLAIINTAIGREITLGPGEQKRYEFGIFIGAKVDTMLEAFPADPGLSALPDADLTEVIDWGWFQRMSKFFGVMMLDLLRWFHSLTGIWGVAIIMLTVVVKLVLLPLTIKQYTSMRKMKELQPDMEKIRTKYGDDKLKQQQEMQALFQRTGINPLAGCLPMLLQFPVWIALYAMLGAVVDLYHEDFLWLPDLTQPDPYYILPLSMGVLMFVQTKMNPTAGDPAQAKMMLWMMPGIFVVMMLFLPSGLGVYIFANIVLSLLQSAIQLRTKGKDAAVEAVVVETSASKKGKGKPK
jgi:YidC/Oxa1 family membrane protein insertase